MIRHSKQVMMAVLVSMSLMTVGSAYAQWSFNIAHDQEYNDNPFRLPTPESSWISTISFAAEREFEDVSVGYYGNYSYFNDFQDRNFYWHQLAMWGGSDTTGWGVYWNQRVNKLEYNIYDYKELTGYWRHRIYFDGGLINWSGNLQLNQYDQLSELNNWKLNTGLRLHKTFKTKTTVITGLGIDYKKYVNSSQLAEVYYDTTMTGMDMPSFSIAGELGNGDGSGHRYGRGGRGYFSGTSYMDFENSSVTQLSFWLRVAQSITPTTGLAVQYSNRTLLSGNNRFVSGITYNYNQESELFNDPLGYESHSLGSELTKILPADIVFKLSAYYVIKNYSAQGIYLDEENYDETILREDTYRTLGIRLKRDFGLNLFGGSQLTLSLNYRWIDNASNSYWYNYKNSYNSIGLELQF